MYTVAGVTGHVGSVVAEELLADGEAVRVLVRGEAKGRPWAGKGAEAAVADLGDHAAMSQALRGTRSLFVLLPMLAASTDPDTDHLRMADTIADAVTDAVATSDLGHVVMLSSLGAELPEGTGPIRYLHHLENRLRETGAVLTALRCCHFQEKAEELLGPARAEGVYPCFAESPDKPTPMIATRDIGRFAASVLRERPAAHEVVDLLGPEYTEREVAKELGALLGRDLAVVPIPGPQQAEVLTQSGVSAQSAAVLAEMYEADARDLLQPGAQRRHTGSTPLSATLRAALSATT